MRIDPVENFFITGTAGQKSLHFFMVKSLKAKQHLIKSTVVLVFSDRSVQNSAAFVNRAYQNRIPPIRTRGLRGGSFERSFALNIRFRLKLYTTRICTPLLLLSELP